MIISVSGKIGAGKDEVGLMINYLAHNSYKFNAKEYDTFKVAMGICSPEHKPPFYKVVKFADKLKDIVCIVLGCTRAQLEDPIYKNKELGKEWDCYKTARLHKLVSRDIYNLLPSHEKEYHHLVKLTPRKMLQLMGTECGRCIIHPQIWVNATMGSYKEEIYRSVDPARAAGFRDSLIFPNWVITDTRFPNELEAVKKVGGTTIRIVDPKAKPLIDEHESETALDNADFDILLRKGTYEELYGQLKTAMHFGSIKIESYNINKKQKYMTDLEKYEAVNASETLEELAEVITTIGEDAEIQGRTRSFNSEKMAAACKNFSNFPPNILTRKWGIRQQAMYINYYL